MFSRCNMVRVWSPERLASLLLVVLLTCSCTQRNTQTFVDGSEFVWEKYRGRWVFINYWAEWCQPCREEIPELNRFATRDADRVAVLAVNFDRLAAADLATGAAKLGIEFPVLLQDPEPWLPHERPTVLPTTMVYDPAGRLERILVGPQTLPELQAVTASDAPRRP